MKYLIGADPELFLKNPNSGEFVSAHGMIPGTKDEPYPVPNGAVQIDGTALEFNIDPASSGDIFVNNITSVMDSLRSMVDPGFTFALEPVATFEPGYFRRDIPKVSKELGCNPDYNAWYMEQNPMPNHRKPMRTASGHIHIGWTENEDVYDDKHFKHCGEVARQLDYYLGCPSLIWDSDNRRRSLYGRAGAFRPKSYGVEYRVLSNTWLRSTDRMRWVYDMSIRACEDLESGRFVGDKEFGNLAEVIINNNQTDWRETSGYHVHAGIDNDIERLGNGTI